MKQEFNAYFTDGKWRKCYGYIEGNWAISNMKWPDRWEITYLPNGCGFPGYVKTRKAARLLIAALEAGCVEDRSGHAVERVARAFDVAHPGLIVWGDAALRDTTYVINALEEVVA